MAEPVMKSYTESTDGSCVEVKESALVWQYRDADPNFGYSQAKEMLDHLESVLANEPVAVKSGQFIVEVKPQASTFLKTIQELKEQYLLIYLQKFFSKFYHINLENNRYL